MVAAALQYEAEVSAAQVAVSAAAARMEDVCCVHCTLLFHLKYPLGGTARVVHPPCEFPCPRGYGISLRNVHPLDVVHRPTCRREVPQNSHLPCVASPSAGRESTRGEVCNSPHLVLGSGVRLCPAEGGGSFQRAGHRAGSAEATVADGLGAAAEPQGWSPCLGSQSSPPPPQGSYLL